MKVDVWGLGLYLICTPTGLLVRWALADPKIGERGVLEAMPHRDADLIASRTGLVLITDKGFSGRATETLLNERGVRVDCRCDPGAAGDLRAGVWFGNVGSGMKSKHAGYHWSDLPSFAGGHPETGREGRYNRHRAARNHH